MSKEDIKKAAKDKTMGKKVMRLAAKSV
jgi:hypothetical protein